MATQPITQLDDPASKADLSESQQDEITQAEEYQPGELAPAIITKQTIWKPDDIKKEDTALIGILTGLSGSLSIADEASRRFSVLEVWEQRLIDRGRQYLEASKSNGGWEIAGAGANTKNQLVGADDANLFPTNIMASQGDIVVGALNRGAIKVSFTPNKKKNPQDVMASDEANKYKHLWSQANNQEELQQTMAGTAWTDPRVIAWTRSVANKSKFGTVDGTPDGEPKHIEQTTLHGVLETKLPMLVDSLDNCGYAQIFEEVDYAVARAMFPWMGDKIKPSSGTAGELEFERIARMNTRLGYTGRLLTGTTGLRETTLGYSWFRPGMYWDDKVQPTQRDWLLKNFPKGLFLIMAGSELVCCWNESMDDVLQLGMFTRGFGQNRRSLGSSDVPIQKRINIWCDLWDKFIRGSIPVTLLESQAFNDEAFAELQSDPRRFMPVALDDTRTMEQLIGQTPQSQPIPGMAEMLQWYLGPLIQSIDGGTPALFGEGEGEDNTVGATRIRLQQSLERHGTAWLCMNWMFAGIIQQAAYLCALNGNTEYEGQIEGVGDVQVNPEYLKGAFKCRPETVNTIPESGAQREAKILQVLDMAAANPEVGALIGSPSNAREIVKGLHLEDVITVDEANWEDCALEDIEHLLGSEPLLNPAFAELQQKFTELNSTHEAAKSAALEVHNSGVALDPQEIEAGSQMEQGVQQLQQQLTSTPQYLPSVPVAQDDSQDHATMAATAFSWMGEPAGRSYRRAAEKEGEGGANWNKWTNVFLYWKGHKDIAEKNKQAQAPPPKISMTGKLTPQQQAQLLLMQAGIQTDPSQLNEPNEQETETITRTPMQEVKTRTKRRL